MGNCKCGCGNPVSDRNFLPGHDQKLRTMLVDEVGGLFALQELVQSAKQYTRGEKDPEEFLEHIKSIFPVKNRR